MPVLVRFGQCRGFSWGEERQAGTEWGGGAFLRVVWPGEGMEPGCGCNPLAIWPQFGPLQLSWTCSC